MASDRKLGHAASRTTTRCFTSRPSIPPSVHMLPRPSGMPSGTAQPHACQHHDRFCLAAFRLTTFPVAYATCRELCCSLPAWGRLPAWGTPASAQSIASNSTPLLSSNQSAKKAHVAFTTFPVQTILAFKFLGRGRQSWFPRLQLKHCPPIAISQLWCPSQSTTWASPPR